MRFMIDHEDIFGKGLTKKDPTLLREIWKEVHGKIQEGDKHR